MMELPTRVQLTTGFKHVQTKNNPYAQYIHCCAHNLNLVINDAVPELRIFFDTFRTAVHFFSAITRWARLMKGPLKNTLKKVCPTRSLCEFDALRCSYFDVMKILTYTSLNGKNTSEQAQANGLMKYFGAFPR